MISGFFRNVGKYSANTAESVFTRPERSWRERERERDFRYSIDTTRQPLLSQNVQLPLICEPDDSDGDVGRSEHFYWIFDFSDVIYNFYIVTMKIANKMHCID
jgi:hypothetical protein